MISDCTIIDAAGCPDEIRSAGNKPWHFVGVVRTNNRYVQTICERCNHLDLIAWSESQDVRPHPVQLVDLPSYRFITDEVVVYWGRCLRCGRVYWARSGPPFRRARVFVTAE